jgi:hypothetical protein
VLFTFEFEVKHNSIENHTVLFEFFSATEGEGKTERVDCPLVDTWEVKNTEGE